ncbi:hypothetical protein JTB14_032535 [Gonioctena quinquepunctata]|nr:hypothetical protein JTB14_032535 [Gonioctena quinquepunctata]
MGGGVGIYIRHLCNASRISFDLPAMYALEYLFLEVKIKTSKLALGVFYRPANKNINNLINDLDNIFPKISSLYDAIICMGDLNYDFLNVQNSLFINCFEAYGLNQILCEATRITATSNELIDPITVNNINFVLKSGTLPSNGNSDHTSNTN